MGKSKAQASAVPTGKARAVRVQTARQARYSREDQLKDSKSWLGAQSATPKERTEAGSADGMGYEPSDSAQLKALINSYKNDIEEYKFRVELLSGVINAMRERDEERKRHELRIVRDAKR